jgi:hypothetical protein
MRPVCRIVAPHRLTGGARKVPKKIIGRALTDRDVRALLERMA